MERSSLLRWTLIGAAVFLFLQYGLPAISGKGTTSDLQPLAGIVDDSAAAERRAEALCRIEGVRFVADLTTKGAALRRLAPTDAKYLAEDGKPTELVTTWIDSRLSLRTNLRAPTGTDQVAYDDLDWQLGETTKTSCAFSYEDESVALTKTVRAGERPFELDVSLTVKNKAAQARTHRLTVENDEWRKQSETQGSWGGQSEWLTQVVVRAEEATRREPGDFEPSDFDEPDFTDEKWRREPGAPRWVAITSTYFAKALVPVKSPSEPAGETLVEEVFDRARFHDKTDDPSFGHVYRARLNYGKAVLEPGATASYELIAFAGPKEREVLAHAAGGDRSTIDLLDLGTFGGIGKLLIKYLYILFGFVGTWGWAICLLTITVKVLLFPLSIAQIKSTIAMRKLKPEMDALNERYKDDAQQKAVALQELWRKNKVANPMLGCLPALLQMPVWFALYTSLQTAVELYHVPFGPFIPDLSAPGKYFIIPVVLGGSSFIQQKLMPMQGDPLQQKMMLYMMPAIFTAMMLFLPAGLGIYFLTNTWLGIAQQVAMERYYKSQEGRAPVPASESADGGPKAKDFGKGNARV